MVLQSEVKFPAGNMKKIQRDMWSTREQLCLASSVSRSGDQNWMSVSRSLRPLGEPNRPPDWFSQKNCAVQYSVLLETVETPKRKKRSEKGEVRVETPGENIVRRLTHERIEELRRLMQEKRTLYLCLKEEYMQVKMGHADDRLAEMTRDIEEAKLQKEKDAEIHAQWLRDREERKIVFERNWRSAVTGPTVQRRRGGLSRGIGIRRNSSQSEPSSEADSPLNEPLNVDVTGDDAVVDVKPPVAPMPTSPLLTSLLRNPSPAPPTSQGTSLLQQAITQRGSSPTINSLLSSAPSVPSTVSSSLKNLVSSALSLAPNVEHTPTSTTSPSAGAPTLSMLLELPPSLPGKPLPELPTATKQHGSAGSGGCPPQHQEIRVQSEIETDEPVEVEAVEHKDEMITIEPKEEPIEEEVIEEMVVNDDTVLEAEVDIETSVHSQLPEDIVTEEVLTEIKQESNLNEKVNEGNHVSELKVDIKVEPNVEISTDSQVKSSKLEMKKDDRTQQEENKLNVLEDAGDTLVLDKDFEMIIGNAIQGLEDSDSKGGIAEEVEVIDENQVKEVLPDIEDMEVIILGKVDVDDDVQLDESKVLEVIVGKDATCSLGSISAHIDTENLNCSEIIETGLCKQPTDNLELQTSIMPAVEEQKTFEDESLDDSQTATDNDSDKRNIVNKNNVEMTPGNVNNKEMENLAKKNVSSNEILISESLHKAPDANIVELDSKCEQVSSSETVTTSPKPKYEKENLALEKEGFNELSVSKKIVDDNNFENKSENTESLISNEIVANNKTNVAEQDSNKQSKIDIEEVRKKEIIPNDSDDDILSNKDQNLKKEDPRIERSKKDNLMKELPKKVTKEITSEEFDNDISKTSAIEEDREEIINMSNISEVDNIAEIAETNNEEKQPVTRKEILRKNRKRERRGKDANKMEVEKEHIKESDKVVRKVVDNMKKSKHNEQEKHLQKEVPESGKHEVVKCAKNKVQTFVNDGEQDLHQPEGKKLASGEYKQDESLSSDKKISELKKAEKIMKEEGKKEAKKLDFRRKAEDVTTDVSGSPAVAKEKRNNTNQESDKLSKSADSSKQIGKDPAMKNLSVEFKRETKKDQEDRSETVVKKMKVDKISAKENSEAHGEEEKTSDVEAPKISGKKKLSNVAVDLIPNSPNANTDEEREYKAWKKAIMLVYGRLATHKYASLFLRPITDEQAPGYSSIVHRPMDLLMIKKNIESGVIRTTSEFQRDVMLMFQNSIMYNKSSHFVNKMAQQMQQEGMQHIQDFLTTQMLVQVVGEVPLRRETRTTEANKNREILPLTDELDNLGKRKRMSASELERSKKRKLSAGEGKHTQDQD